ncbi:MAG: flagellar motor switch protein FliM [Proteobacteria bacterium]|nr:flagellar motor switch protein FliM [Pseudomonadota bacterium]
MPEVLSQAEIDSLLSAVSTGEVESDSGKKEEPLKAGSTGSESSPNWIAYDLTSHEKIVRGKMIALQGIHERFARLFRASLTNHLKRQVSVSLNRMDFMKFGDYLNNLVLPTSVNIVNMTDLKGSLLFIVSSKLTYALVDAYYGGSERPFSKVGNRDEFTSIENNMISKVSSVALKDLQESWKLNYPLKLQYLRSETNPHFIGTIHPSELVAVLTIDVEFESLSGPCFVVLQLEPLNKIQEYLAFNVTGDFSVENGEWRDHWIREVMSTELLLQVELGATQKKLGEIESLQPGSTLLLSQDSVAPLTVYVQGLPLMAGMMGNVRGNLAIRMTQTLQSKDSSEGDINEQGKVANG